MMRFVQPLLKGCNDGAQLEKALKLGMLFWNLALAGDDRREEMLARLANKLPDDLDATEFHALASDMANRHRAMFPTLHQRY
jgi:hypothetical protein